MKNALFLILLFIAYHSSAQFICPDNITINCDEDYTDTLVIGTLTIPDSLNVEDVNTNFTPQLNSCGVGVVFVAYNLDDSLICSQTVTVENPFPPFDSSSIVMPNDTTYTTCGVNYEPPTFTSNSCDFIGYSEDFDTVSFTSTSEFTLERSIRVIDWCLYDETDGAEGLYLGSHLISIIDENPPTPFCLSLYGLGDSQFPHTIEAKMFNLGAFEDCSTNDSIRFTFSNIPPENDPEYNPLTRSSSKVFELEDFDSGSILQDIYHWDLAGNSDYCSVSLSVTEDCLPQNNSLVDSQNQWNVTTISGPNYNTTKQRFKSEEVSLQGKKYLQIETAEEENSEDWTDYPLYMRECNGRLYGRDEDSNEELYFDFNLEIGDTLFSEQYIGAADLRIDSIYNKEYLDGSIRKTLYVEALNGFGYFEMIEGIGSTIFPMTEYQNIAWIDFSQTLGCFTANDEVVYIGDSFSSCWPVGVDDQLDEDAIEIYPNPGFSSVNIYSEYDGNLKIHSVDGNQVYNSQIQQGINAIEIDNWHSGLYFITILTKEGSITNPWIKD